MNNKKEKLSTNYLVSINIPEFILYKDKLNFSCVEEWEDLECRELGVSIYFKYDIDVETGLSIIEKYQSEIDKIRKSTVVAEMVQYFEISIRYTKHFDKPNNKDFEIFFSVVYPDPVLKGLMGKQIIEKNEVILTFDNQIQDFLINILQENVYNAKYALEIFLGKRKWKYNIMDSSRRSDELIRRETNATLSDFREWYAFSDEF